MSSSSNKRSKVQLPASTIVSKLDELTRDALLEIATSALLAPSVPEETLQLASDLLMKREDRMLHCVRCHKNRWTLD